MQSSNLLNLNQSEMQPRQKILLTALELFAELGFERTTIRQISKKAEVNVSAIGYYFGDKAGLYQAAFVEPMGSPKDDIALFNSPEISLEQALNGLFTGFVEPLKDNKLAQLCTRLHMREMVEPTGLWEKEINDGITPYHHALLLVLQRHLKLNSADDDLHRLAVCIVAMGVHLFVGRDVIDKVCPQIINSNKALDKTRHKLVSLAMSMIEAEAILRKHKVA